MKATTVVTTGQRKLGLDESSWTFRFKFEGRRYTLIKRNPSRDGAWWLATVVHGTRIVRSLDTNVASAAEDRAVAKFIRPAKAGQWLAVAAHKLKTEWPTIGRLCDAYLRLAATRSAQSNINGLHRVLVLAGAAESPAAAAKLSTTVLTGRLLRDFKTRLLAERTAGLAGDEAKRAERRATITGGAYVRFARAVLSRDMLQRYRDEGLRLPPSVAEFIAERVFKSVRVDYNPPNDAVIAATFAWFERLGPAKHLLGRNLHRAFWLIIGTGLRKGEAARTRWEHFVQRGGEWCLSGAVVGKDGLDVTLPVLGQSWAKLAPLQQASGLVLEGGPREVKDRVWRRLGRRLRKLGWKTQKYAHELRAFAISKVAESHGIWTASEWARHKDPALTRAKYARYLSLKGIKVELPAQP